MTAHDGVGREVQDLGPLDGRGVEQQPAARLAGGRDARREHRDVRRVDRDGDVAVSSTVVTSQAMASARMPESADTSSTLRSSQSAPVTSWRWARVRT